MYINNNPLLVADSKKPISLSDWINHQNSLTDKLLASKGSIDLELLSQEWTTPTWWDKYLLQINLICDVEDREGEVIKSQQLVFQREILMRSENIAYWYARTIIPQKCYDLNPDFFGRLEKESIRNLIFGNHEVHRVLMTGYPIDKQCIEFYWVKKYINTIKGTLWVRFGEFSYHHMESFYLMEILLPELENLD